MGLQAPHEASADTSLHVRRKGHLGTAPAWLPVTPQLVCVLVYHWARTSFHLYLLWYHPVCWGVGWRIKVPHYCQLRVDTCTPYSACGGWVGLQLVSLCLARVVQLLALIRKSRLFSELVFVYSGVSGLPAFLAPSPGSMRQKIEPRKRYISSHPEVVVCILLSTFQCLFCVSCSAVLSRRNRGKWCTLFKNNFYDKMLINFTSNVHQKNFSNP